MLATCKETVSILQALVFGAHGACIDLSLASILMAAGAFVAAAVLLKVFGLGLLVLLARPLRSLLARKSDGQDSPPDAGPIRTRE